MTSWEAMLQLDLQGNLKMILVASVRQVLEKVQRYVVTACAGFTRNAVKS